MGDVAFRTLENKTEMESNAANNGKNDSKINRPIGPKVRWLVICSDLPYVGFSYFG